MPRQSYYGICQLCGARLSKVDMTKHLGICTAKHDKEGAPVKLFQLRVEGDGMKTY